MSPFTKAFIFAVIIADLFALIIFGGRFILTGSILADHTPAPVMVAGAEEDTDIPAPDAAAKPAFDYATYVADIAKGEKVAAKCKACHTFEAGGPDRVGPNLWAIMGAPVKHKAGYAYSGAMDEVKSRIGTWSEDEMFVYLENPRAYAPGTKMQFNGIKNPEDRADLVAWMKTLK